MSRSYFNTALGITLAALALFGVGTTLAPDIASEWITGSQSSMASTPTAQASLPTIARIPSSVHSGVTSDRAVSELDLANRFKKALDERGIPASAVDGNTDLLKDLCQEDIALACRWASQMLSSEFKKMRFQALSAPMKSLKNESIDLSLKACALGSSEACIWPISEFRDERGIAGIRPLQTFCQSGDSHACSLLGDFFHQIKGQDSKAERVLVRICLKGNAKACRDLGLTLAFANRTDDAYPFLKKSCEFGDSQSCQSLSQAVENQSDWTVASTNSKNW